MSSLADDHFTDTTSSDVFGLIGKVSSIGFALSITSGLISYNMRYDHMTHSGTYRIANFDLIAICYYM